MKISQVSVQKNNKVKMFSYLIGVEDFPKS